MNIALSDKYFKIRHCLELWQQQETCKSAKIAISQHAAEWNQRIADGQPAFEEIAFPLPLAADALISVLSTVEDRPMSLALEEAAHLIENYLESKLSEQASSCQTTDDAQLRMYIHLVCQTIMSIMAEPILSDEVSRSWRKNICPACGSAPVLAYCDNSGKRKLVCGTCTTHWQFKRLGCAVCGEENHENLRVLKAEEDCDGWTIQICKSCHGYLKIADLRELAQTPDWMFANIATLPMDYAAEKWLTENL